jgi:enoyl-CoA hydratase/carnithine racemase
LEPSNTFLEQLIPFWYYWDETRQVTKPTIAAIDGYAIGSDSRWLFPATGESARAIMWALKKRVACPLGAYMLEKFFARKQLNEVTGLDDPLEKAVARAEASCAYPEIPYRRTKESINRTFTAGLQDVAEVAKEVHVSSCMSKSEEQHFNRVRSQ